MAAAEVKRKQHVARYIESNGSSFIDAVNLKTAMMAKNKPGEGLRQYYLQHIHDLQLQVRQKSHNLNRLEAQRNDLNSRVRMLKEELQLLQEPGSYVGEVVKVMGKSKVLVKVHPEGKYVVDIDKSIDITKITPTTRVALRNDSYVLHLVLPSKVDPLVNLMKVEKVPDSTYDMIGGLDQQIKEIKEVIELPIKHPELFESLGIAQPKGVLLYGPPGTGKTLLARAVAHHTDCIPSLGFLVHIGEGYRMVRELCVMAREHAPSIIFMDEIHSIGSARMESGTGNGDSEVQRTMLELLNQLEGFEASNKIKLLMATNTIDILDSALLRPTNMLLGLSRNFRLQSDFISNPTSLRRRLMLIEIAMLLLSPFSIIFMVVFHFLRHAERFYNHPSIASSRRWSNLSRWIFREFNEVDHLFKHRMNSSVIHADEYLKQFPSPIISIIAKFVSFVFGGFAAILIIIAILDESLLEGHIYGRNLLWYAAVFGTVTAISRAAITEDLQVRNPEGAMSLVVQHTHHMPKRWRGKENSDVVRTEFETLFQYTGMMLLEEMASIFLTPFLLIFVVPQRVEDILQFISNFTVDVEGVGHVCSLSVFDFERHGNSNYAAPYNTPRTQRSSQGKLEKSFLSFHSSYPTWEPDAAGKQFLSTLRSFRDQNLPGRTRQEFGYPRNWQLNLNLRNQGNMGGIPITGYQLGSLWIVDSDQNSHPYLLDWYYTSRFPRTLNDSEDIPPPPPTERERDRDIWRPYNPAGTQAGPRFEQNWGFHLDEERARSPMEASTSTPSFRESVLQHHNTGYLERPVENHWWARNDPNSGGGTQASFLEPPDYNHQVLENIHENYSDRSSEEQEQRLDWRNSQLLSRTTCIEEDVAGADEDFNPPFDIYCTPSEETKMKSQNSNHETV